MKAAHAIIAITFLITGLLPLAAADNDSLQVVVLVEDKDYSVGTTGTVTVHVLDKGVHVDADKAPSVRMGVYPSREINVTKKATGVYEGKFTLQSGDIFAYSATITADATLGKTNDTDTSYNEDSASASLLLPLTSSTGLSVDLSLIHI